MEIAKKITASSLRSESKTHPARSGDGSEGENVGRDVYARRALKVSEWKTSRARSLMTREPNDVFPAAAREFPRGTSERVPCPPTVIYSLAYIIVVLLFFFFPRDIFRL